MLAKGHCSPFYKGIILVLVVLLTAPVPLLAQYYGDESVQDEFTDSIDEFVEEDIIDDFDAVAPDDFSEGGKFIDEEKTFGLGETVTISGRRTTLRLKGEKEMLPLNSAWGAGTGLLIGGWFALIENGDDRTTQKAIGMGIILGTLLGVFLGMKTLIAPEAPRAALLSPETGPMQSINLAATAEEPFKFSFSLKF